nr:hypothetical protein [Volvox reticuliferus]BCL66235.1 hypothetical protein [Volvox reticuliferus]
MRMCFEYVMSVTSPKPLLGSVPAMRKSSSGGVSRSVQRWRLQWPSASCRARLTRITVHQTRTFHNNTTALMIFPAAALLQTGLFGGRPSLSRSQVGISNATAAAPRNSFLVPYRLGFGFGAGLFPPCIYNSAAVLPSESLVRSAVQRHGVNMTSAYGRNGIGSMPYGSKCGSGTHRAPTRAALTHGTGGRGAGGPGGDKPDAVISSEAADFWRKAMTAIDRPGLGLLVATLEWSHPLGVTRHRARGRVQCYDTFLATKKKHPTAVVLVRIGEFYEAVGFDALVLCQHCGLNPMAPHTGVAEAGFPRAANSLRRQLNRLIDAGFAVAMVEEVREIRRSGSALPSKERKLTSIVSSSSPYYLYGDVEDEYEGDDTPLPKPIVGISVPSSGGYRLLRYCPQRRTVQVQSQLSTEALVSYLHATGVAQPLRLHSSVRDREREGGKGPSLGRMLSAVLGTTVAEYGIGASTECSNRSQLGSGRSSSFPPGSSAGFDDVSGFKRVVAAQLGMDAQEAEAMEVVPFALESKYDTPLPPSLSTVTQLGLAGACGVPSLLSAVLPEGTPAPSREWMRRLLLLPPPPTVAEDIRVLCRQLADSGENVMPLPPLVTSLPGPRIAALLAGGAAGHNTMRELQAMLVRVSELLSLPGPRAKLMHCALGGVLEWSLSSNAGLTWAQVPPEVFAQRCMAAAAAIEQVVPPLEVAAVTGRCYPSEDEGEGEDAEDGAGGELGPPRPRSYGFRDDNNDELLTATPVLTRLDSGRSVAVAANPILSAALLPFMMSEAGVVAADGSGHSSYSPVRQLSFSRRRALEAVSALVERMEGFRRAVREERLQAAADKVSACRNEMVAALMELVTALEEGGPAAGVDVRLAAHDDAVWARLVTFSGSTKCKMSAAQQRSVVEAVRRATGLELIHPLNRKRGVEGDRYSSARLEAATAAYRLAVDAADKEARSILRELCKRLHGQDGAGGSGHHLVTVLAAAELSVVFTALERHVARTKQTGWNWPVMPAVHSLSQPGGAAGREVQLVLPSLWPYWMERREAVANSLTLQAGRVALLTGPNMAGKSTILRSIAAAALLAICGLSVPAGPERGSGHSGGPAADLKSPHSGHSGGPAGPPADFFVSWLSHVSLRNFSGDSPLEGKSAFAVEMEDTAHTLDVAASAGRRCLVLLDELGKGTEVVAGSALAAAVVEALVRTGSAAVFATHLHDLVFLLQPLQSLGQLEYWAMEVATARQQQHQHQQQPDQMPYQQNPLLPFWQQQQQQLQQLQRPQLPEALRPTRRVIVGQVCFRSLALQVAEACGLHRDVLAAAAKYEARLGDMMQRAREGMYAGQLGAAQLGVRPSAPSSASQLAASQHTMPTAAVLREAAMWRPERSAGPYAGADWPLLAGWRGRAAAEGVVVPFSDWAVQAAPGREGEWAEDTPPGARQAEAAVHPTAMDDGSGAGYDCRTSTMTTMDAINCNGVMGKELPPAEMRTAAPTWSAADDSNRMQLLQSAAEVLRELVRGATERAGYDEGQDSGQLHWVKPEWRPAPGHAGEAVVYVLLRWDGLLYVGESEDIATRLKTHRAAETRERRAKGRQLLAAGKRNATSLQCVYCVIPREAGGKSTARDVEAELIGRLRKGPWELRSDYDKARDALHRPQLPSQAWALALVSSPGL